MWLFTFLMGSPDGTVSLLIYLFFFSKLCREAFGALLHNRGVPKVFAVVEVELFTKLH